ncbi:hypothetical protein ABG067_004772, partial [Albugo candida]
MLAIFAETKKASSETRILNAQTTRQCIKQRIYKTRLVWKARYRFSPKLFGLDRFSEVRSYADSVGSIHAARKVIENHLFFQRRKHAFFQTPHHKRQLMHKLDLTSL